MSSVSNPASASITGSNFAFPQIGDPQFAISTSQLNPGNRTLSQLDHLGYFTRMFQGIVSNGIQIVSPSLTDRVTHLQTLLALSRSNIAWTKQMKLLIQQDPNKTDLEKTERIKKLDDEIEFDNKSIRELEELEKKGREALSKEREVNDSSNGNYFPPVSLNREPQLGRASDSATSSDSQIDRISSKTRGLRAPLSSLLLNESFFREVFSPGTPLKLSSGAINSKKREGFIEMKVNSYETKGGKVYINLTGPKGLEQLQITQQGLFYKPETDATVLFKLNKKSGYLKGLIKSITPHKNPPEIVIQIDRIHNYQSCTGEVVRTYNLLSSLIPMPNQGTLDKVFQLSPCSRNIQDRAKGFYTNVYVVRPEFRLGNKP